MASIHARVRSRWLRTVVSPRIGTGSRSWQSRVAQWAQHCEGRKGRGLALLAVVVYTPALFGGFVWDDWIFVNEPLVRRLDGIVSIWLSPSEILRENHYWPVTYTTFWIEHKLWGFNPVGYHAVNIALHALNSVLVWRLLLRLGVPGAWLVAAVFAVHPVHVESVAWIIERKDLLSALFYLGAVHVWLRFTEAPGPGRYVLCLALFAAALLSKSIVVTLPATLLLLRWWQAGRVTWRDAACVAPLFALALGVTLADLAFYRDRIDSALDYSLVERALIAARALWVYAHQLVWPAFLPVLYPRWEVHPGDLLGWLAIAALVALGTALWLARDRIGRGPLAGALFFALTLSPVLGFVDFRFMKIAFVADRFQYLASIGPLAVILGVAVYLAGRLHPRNRRALAGVAVAILVALGALSWRQSGIYRDDLTYFRHIDAANPRHDAGQLGLSRQLAAAGHYEEALAAARRGFALAEGRRGNHMHWAYAVLGNALLALERPVEAETALRASLALWPRSERNKPRLLLALALVRQARYEEGLALYRALIREDPDDDAAHLSQGMALLESGRHEAAVESFNRALAVVRDLGTEPHLHALLGEARRKLGHLDAAAAHLDEAIALDPGNVWFLLARVDVALDRERTGRLPSGDGRSAEQAAGRARREASAAGFGARLAEARERCETMIEQQPGYTLARVALGAVLQRMEEYETAATVLEEALALAPSRPVARDAHLALGEIFEKRGRPDAAARHWRSALDIHPLDATALERLAGLRLRQERYEGALPLYRRLVEVTPFVAQAHVNLGVALYRTGRLPEALLALDRALELAPGLEGARDLRSRVIEAQVASATPRAAARQAAPS